MERLALEALVGQQGGIAVDDKLGVLQAHKSDEQANAHADGGFEGGGNSVKERLPDIGQRQNDEDDAFCKDRHQGHLPGVAHLQHDGVGKVGVQAHAGGQCKGVVGQQCHQRRTDEGGQRGGNENGVGIHPGGRKDAGVDCENIRHGHEGSDTCHDLGFGVGMIFPQLENSFEHEIPPAVINAFFPSKNRETHFTISDIVCPYFKGCVLFFQKFRRFYRATAP